MERGGARKVENHEKTCEYLHIYVTTFVPLGASWGLGLRIKVDVYCVDEHSWVQEPSWVLESPDVAQDESPECERTPTSNPTERQHLNVIQ
eukprot:3463333-Amphidinium_carterae.1